MESLTSRLFANFSEIGVESLVDASAFEGNAGWTRLKGNVRESDVACSLDGSIVLMTFWDKGHVCGKISTGELGRFAMTCKIWFVDNFRLAEIQSRFPEIEVQPVEPLLYGEVEALRDWTWNKVEGWLSQESGRLRLTGDLLVLAKNDSLLRSLFPYTSHDNLRFSDNSGYPFNADLPYLSPIDEHQILVYHGNSRTMTSSPSEAVELLRREMANHNLHPRIGL